MKSQGDYFEGHSVDENVLYSVGKHRYHTTYFCFLVQNSPHQPLLSSTHGFPFKPDLNRIALPSFSVHSSFNMRGWILCPHKTTNHIVVLYILSFDLLPLRVCIAKRIEYSIPSLLLQGLQHTPCCTIAGCCITGSTSVGSDGTDGPWGPQDIPAFSSPRCLRRPQQTATNPGGKYHECLCTQVRS